ncbi:hypothetical protein Dimus_016542 [Dionaea muscipula]
MGAASPRVRPATSGFTMRETYLYVSIQGHGQRQDLRAAPPREQPRHDAVRSIVRAAESHATTSFMRPVGGCASSRCASSPCGQSGTLTSLVRAAGASRPGPRVWVVKAWRVPPWGQQLRWTASASGQLQDCGQHPPPAASEHGVRPASLTGGFPRLRPGGWVRLATPTRPAASGSTMWATDLRVSIQGRSRSTGLVGDDSCGQPRHDAARSIVRAAESHAATSFMEPVGGCAGSERASSPCE